MQIQQIRWTAESGWEATATEWADTGLVLVFADTPYFESAACYNDLRERYPAALIAGCSSSGSILDVSISDDDAVATLVRFEHARVRLARADIQPDSDQAAVAAALMAELAGEDLRHVFVLTDGLQVNGSTLARGLNRAGIAVSGGMAGDGARFKHTWVMANAPAAMGVVAAIGFYGPLQIRSGCFAGYEEFGAERLVTRSQGNVVYEIDGEPALDLYKRYLADQAAGLPASGLRFPLSIQSRSQEHAVIRTLLAVDEAERSLTYAGDVPQGHLCKLMRTNVDSLIEHAGKAAVSAMPQDMGKHGLCLVVSCVGRRLVMGQLTEEELDVVREKLGAATTIAGFYSYGELAPFSDVLQCQLHNQTMTLTTFYE